MLAGVFLTALYMTRQMFYVFFGNRREASQRAHESPKVMTLPLATLAVCAVLLSIVLTPAWPWLDSYLTGEPVRTELGHLIQPILFLSLALVLAGIGVGVLLYRRTDGKSDALEKSLPAIFRFLENKMWIDELYEKTVLAWSPAAARISDWLDRCVWDGIVRTVGAITRGLSFFTANFDEGGINSGVDQGCESAQGLGRLMSAWHSGLIQNYLRVIGIATLALLVLYIWQA
jgi:NADH-quinone oxidoreductase subunit L